MTAETITEIVANQLRAEAHYLAAASSFPCIRAERRRILEEQERELAAAVAHVLAGRPADGSGISETSAVARTCGASGPVVSDPRATPERMEMITNAKCQGVYVGDYCGNPVEPFDADEVAGPPQCEDCREASLEDARRERKRGRSLDADEWADNRRREGRE